VFLFIADCRNFERLITEEVDEKAWYAHQYSTVRLIDELKSQSCRFFHTKLTDLLDREAVQESGFGNSPSPGCKWSSN